MKIIPIILALYFVSAMLADTEIYTSYPTKEVMLLSEYTGCPDGSYELKEQTLSVITTTLTSQRQSRIQKRAELNMVEIDPEQLRKLDDPADSAACHQINQFLNEYQVGVEDETLSPVFYEAGGFYFAAFGVQSGSMLGYVPVYTFNQDFELIYVWMV